MAGSSARSFALASLTLRGACFQEKGSRISLAFLLFFPLVYGIDCLNPFERLRCTFFRVFPPAIDAELVNGPVRVVPLVGLQKAFLSGIQVPSVFSRLCPSVPALRVVNRQMM